MTREFLRSMLARHFGNDLRMIAHFEDQAQTVEDSSSAASSAALATDKMQDATVIVLSANQGFNNERVLRRGPGVKMVDTGTALIIEADDSVAMLAGAQTLTDKTLDAPILSSLGDYVDDAAAAVGGVPLGGVYHNAGALRIRIA